MERDANEVLLALRVAALHFVPATTDEFKRIMHDSSPDFEEKKSKLPEFNGKF
jgi:hypothetical protein